MLGRVAVVTFNTYREAVRAKILHGLFAMALATTGYAVVVGQFTQGSAARVLSNLGSAALSLYGTFVAIVLSATALHRELELKTVFPILARPISRTEYLVGKYLGTVVTLAVFIAGNAAVLLAALAATGTDAGAQVAVAAVLAVAGAALLGWRVPSTRTLAPLFAALVLLGSAWLLCAEAPDDRRVVAFSSLLTLLEIMIVAAVATLFSSFSTPFLTAVLTLGVFLVGRSADTLAQLPARVFGEPVHRAGELLSRVVPNLMIYVPERALLTGEAVSVSSFVYTGRAALAALGWSLALLSVASLVFRRRDLV
jgi:Cu-processing system permease protein